MSATPPGQQLPPLVGDPTRQAIDSMLGYDYQIIRTVEAWLQLRDEEKIYIECAEDYDVISPVGATATQIKNSPTPITLNSEDVRATVRNFWLHRERNKGHAQVSLRFLTRGTVGKEQKSNFASERGIQLWRKAAAGDDAAGRLVADHLLAQGGPGDFVTFLRESNSSRLREELFSRIEWVTDEPSIDAVHLSVSRLVINMGSKASISPIVSERALPALLEHCRQTARQRESDLRTLNLADAQLVFEKNTSLPVPITGQLQTAMALMSASTGGSVTAMNFAAIFDGELPELPVECLPRLGFVNDIVSQVRVSGCVLVVGSEGEGKSTAANMAARVLGPTAYWMDLRGGDENVSAAAIENAIVIARSDQRPKCIVLDDVPAAQGVSDTIWGRLRALVDTCRRGAISLIMTSKGVPADVVDPKFRSAKVGVVPVPRIGEEELIDFFKSLGCSSPMAPNWARVTLAHTGSGHPKLVHLAGLELRDRSWKVTDVADFLSPPTSVEEARAAARQTAVRTVVQPGRDLLFALSMVTAAFERPVALEVGKRIGIGEPGVTFDRLVGRWVESRGRAGYKVTPLLSNQAQQLWPADQIRRFHAVLLESFMATKSIRLDQAMDLFMHAMLSEDSLAFARFTLTMLDHLEKTEGLAEALELIVHIGAEEAPAIRFDENASMLFRVLQFRVARARRPERLPELARQWKREIAQLADVGHRKVATVLFGLSVVTAIEVTFDAKTMLDAVNAASGMEALGIETPVMTAADWGLAAKTSDEAIDPMQVLFLVAQSSLGSTSRMLEMVNELGEIPSALRNRLLGAFNLPLAREGFSMFDHAFLSEVNAAEPNWTGLVSALERAVAAGRGWDATAFEASAARILSIVLSENLGDESAAQLILEKAAAGAPTPLVKEQMANLAFRRGDYERATSLWSECLDRGKGDGAVRDPFAMRKAAIACSRLGRFGEAGQWFEDAAHIASLVLQNVPAGLFTIDASYCWFIHGDARKALAAAARVRREVLLPVDPEANPRVFLAQKCLGHVLLWMRMEVLDPEVKVHPPIVGMASNPDVDLGAIGEAPATPPDVIALAIVELCLLLEIEEPWTPEVLNAAERSSQPFFRARYRAARLRHVIAHGRFSEAGLQIYELFESILRMGVAGKRERAGLPPVDDELPDAAFRRSMSEILAYAIGMTLTLAVISGVDRVKLIDGWRGSLPTGDAGSFMRELIAEISKHFEVSGSEAMREVRTSSSWPGRVGAAVAALREDSRSPLEITHAQWVLCEVAFGNQARPYLRLDFGRLIDVFVDQWRRRLINPALLVNPRVTVPLLKTVLASEASPSRKLLALMLVTAEACGSRLPDSVREKLQFLADLEGPCEEKARALAQAIAPGPAPK